MDEARTSATSLHTYLGVVRRRLALVIVPIILVPLAAVAFSLHQQKLFQASAQVLITNQNSGQALLGQSTSGTAVDPTRQASTDTTVAHVPEVARRTLASLGLRGHSVGDLLNHTAVSAASDADILRFSVTDPNPRLAVRLVNEYAKQFIGYRQQLDTASVTAALGGINLRIHALEARAAKRKHPGAALRDELHNLLKNQQNLQTLQKLQGGKLFVVQPASSATQTQPTVVRNGLIGVALGVIFGLSLAFFVNALDTRVRSAEEVAAILGLGLIGRVPTPPRSLRRRNRLAMLAPCKQGHREAYRTLRTGFDLANLKINAKTILVTSALEAEGKSTTAANLAVALARAGHHVALVDLDLRRPLIAKFFQVGGAGVTDVAIGAAPIQDALTTIAVGHGISATPNANGNGNGSTHVQGLLEVMTSGPLPADPTEFLATKELSAIIEQLRARCDLVLIDSPPALPVADPMTLSSVVDAMLIVVRAGLARRGSLAELRRLLDTAPAARLGFVLTGADVDGDYGYGDGYAYTETLTREVARPTAQDTPSSTRS